MNNDDQLGAYNNALIRQQMACNRQYNQHDFANIAWGAAYQQAMNSTEIPQSRAFRLLAEAKARHPEWEVKRLSDTEQTVDKT